MSDRYRLTDLADDDLFSLSLYLAHQAGVESAERFIDSLNAKFTLLADMPGMGRQREELAPKLRSFPFREYVIFYRLMENELLIVRILHGSRDLSVIFPSEEQDQ